MFLKLDNAEIGYQKSLLSKANAELYLGEVALLIGDNGVGKTTLLKSILGQLPLLDGKIIIDGKSSKELSSSEIASKIAVVYSKATLPANYTVYDLVSLGKFIHYPFYFNLNKEDKISVEQVIENLGLSIYKHKKLTELSDGNLQKAFIGRALAQNSPFILLDEPTTHLDEKNKIQILQILRELAVNSNKLILFSSHDWRLAKEFSDKIWYLSNGELKSGITEEILLENKELINPELFTFSNHFRPPTISAPKNEAEMMYSFLQKNINFDLSEVSVLYKDTIWHISKDNFQHSATNFEELLKILQNIH